MSFEARVDADIIFHDTGATVRVGIVSDHQQVLNKLAKQSGSATTTPATLLRRQQQLSRRCNKEHRKRQSDSAVITVGRKDCCACHINCFYRISKRNRPIHSYVGQGSNQIGRMRNESRLKSLKTSFRRRVFRLAGCTTVWAKVGGLNTKTSK